MKKTAIFGFVALFVIGLVATGAYAFGERALGNDDLRIAMENGDYDAYIQAFDQNDRGFMRHQLTEEEFNERLNRQDLGAEHRAVVEEALASGDYDAWLVAMEDAPRGNQFASLVTEDNFDEFIQIHEARESGDFDLAAELAQELGIEPGQHGKRGGMGSGQHDGLGRMRGCMQ